MMTQTDNTDELHITHLKTWLTYAGCLAVSAVFMLVFSLWTSPFYKNWYGCDASFFTLVGRGMLNGKIPYRDFYDLKGPYFFFIQALGQLICRGRTGIFILQIIALFFSLILIYRTGRLYLPYGKTLGIMAFFLWPYVSMLWGGNCLEEFCLPLNLLVIYLSLKLFSPAPVREAPKASEASEVSEVSKESEASEESANGYEALESMKDDGRDKRMHLTAALTGLCFGIMAFSKITAGAPLIGLVIGIFILHLVKKEYRAFLFYAVYFILGLSISFIPLLIYYGYHGSILKMLYCTFIFGFKRSSDLSGAFALHLETKLMGVIFSIVFLLLHAFGKRRIRYELSLLLLPANIVTYLALHLGDSFIYYFITGMPCLTVTLILFTAYYDPLILFKNLKQSLCWLLLFVFVFHYTKESLNTVDMFIHKSDAEFQDNYYRDAKNMGTLIPECDRDSVFSFDIDMQWYEINNLLPCNRYPINLQYFIALEPSIEQELFDFLDKTPPKWMICSNTLQDYLPQMDEIVKSRYDCIYSTDVGLVYLLRD